MSGYGYGKLGADGGVDTPPNMLPRNEPSTVRDSIDFAMKKMNMMTKQRRRMPAMHEMQHAGGLLQGAGGAALEASKRALAARGASLPAQTRMQQRTMDPTSSKQFDAAMSNPALKNLGL